jgi:hypothetical protein
MLRLRTVLTGKPGITKLISTPSQRARLSRGMKRGFCLQPNGFLAGFLVSQIRKPKASQEPEGQEEEHHHNPEQLGLLPAA